MKQKNKSWLAGVLVGSMALSAVALAQPQSGDESMAVSAITSVGETEAVFSTIPYGADSLDQVVLEEKSTTVADMSIFKNTDVYFETLASSALFDQFYGQYGYEKSAYVFYNGKELPFTDAFPLIENGTTFLPLAVFADVIGAKTDYIAETHSVSLVYQGDTITFDIGKASFNVNGGAAQELPYETFTANDRTMVPLRFITDAFGLSLYWNDAYKQVIAADLDSLTAGKEFTMMNGLFDFMNGEVTGQNAKVAGEFDYTLTMNGKTMDLSSVVNAHANDDMSGVAYELDFAVDVTPFETEIREILNSMSPDPVADAAMVDVLLESIQNFEFNYKYDFENLVFYLQCDLIADILPAVSTSSNNLGVSQSTWYKLSLSDFMSAKEIASMQAMMSQLSGQKAVGTVDDMVTEMMEMTRYQDNNLADSYGALKVILEDTHDGAFQETEGGYTASGSYSNSGESAYYDLTVKTDEDKNVVGYSAILTFQENNSDVVRLTINQDTHDVADVVVDGAFSGVSVSMNGQFTVEYTNDKASVRPSGSDIFDLSTYF